MPDISAFRGIRYDLGHVGSLANVVAPPYDVIDAAEQDALYKRHPANVVRLILNRDEPGDNEQSNRYTRAGRFLRNWLREGVLFTEAEPAVYVYHQTFDHGGMDFTRRGFICRVRLERFGEGSIKPHEETHARAKEDRLQLTRACGANLSPIFGLFPDDANRAQSLLDAAVHASTPLEVRDDKGVLHRMWPVTDLSLISSLTAAMGGRSIYIADGHHRYETACAYRDQLAAKLGSPLPPAHPANHVMMMCVSMSDPGMLVLPTHRLFRGLPPMSSKALAGKLGEFFHVEPAGQGRLRAFELWNRIEAGDRQDTLGFYCAEDQAWILARLNRTGGIRMAELEPDRSDAWRDLGVSILHRLVIDSILGGANLPAPKYVRSLDELTHGLAHGDEAGRDATGQSGTGGRFELAALVMPASLEHVRQICESGERMPPKSTFFYPKLLSGLVINPLK
jgi:uncharacterized protein (DUF1015 family)